MARRKAWFAVTLLMLFPASVSEQPRITGAASLPPLDYLEIQQLVARYSVALDTGDDNGQALARLFTPDGVLVYGSRVVGGRRSLAEFAHGHSLRQGPRNVRHFLTNVLIEQTPQGAAGTQFQVEVEFRDGAEAGTLGDTGQYNDVYTKTPQGWRFKLRKFTRSITTAEAAKASIRRAPETRPRLEALRVDTLKSTPGSPRPMMLTPQDYIEIQQLVARYGIALDSGADNGYLYANLFTPDATAFDQWIGREEIATIPRWNPHGTHYVRHLSTNHVIEPTADGAIGKQYVVVIDIGENGQPSTIFLGGHYEDVYVKTPQGWRFRYRTEFRSASGAKPVAVSSSTTPASVGLEPVAIGKSMALTAMDYFEIQQLVARYPYVVNTGADKGYAMADLFVADGVFIGKLVPYSKGREEIAALARGGRSGRTSFAILRQTTSSSLPPTARPGGST